MTTDIAAERLKFRGRLAEANDRKRDIRIRIEAHRDELRSLLDPFEKVENLNGDRIAALAVELADAVIAYKEVLAEAEAIAKALGR